MAVKSRLVLVSLLLALGVFLPAAPVAGASDRLPDLGMAQITNIQITKENGRRLLRFTTRIVNLGVGAFEARGSRPDTATSEMSVKQRIYNDAGGYRDVSTSTTMFYAGDGHNHWHMRDLQLYELDRLDNGVKVGTGAKRGFCFYDNVDYRALPGHPSNPVYTTSTNPPACAQGQPSALQAVMGLSIGWGDKYPWNIGYQYIDITGLKAGRYQLYARVNTQLGLQESNPNNDSTWVKIQIESKNGTKLTVLEYGPSA